MSTVIMKRGNNADLENTPYTDGLIFFNTDDKCIYLDNGVERGIYGGRVSLLTNVATSDGATNYNVYSALAVKNGFCIKSNVADTRDNINNTTDTGRPVGCVGFKSVIGTTALNNVGSDGTVTDSVSKINNRLVVENNRFVFDYKDGKWGFNTSDERGADTFHPFNSTSLRISPTSTSTNINTDIIASNISLNINKSSASAMTALPLAYYKGDICLPAVTTKSYKVANKVFVKGGILHYFNDYKVNYNPSNPVIPTGTHRHYMYLNNKWYLGSELTPFTKSNRYTQSVRVFPFVVPTIKQYNDTYYRSDTVYYGVCYSQHDVLVDASFNSVDIYKYEPDNSYYQGTWTKVYEANLTESADYHFKDFAFGEHNVVYHGDLYLLNAQYKFSTNELDWDVTNTNKLYKWSSRTNTFTNSPLPLVLYNNNTIIYSMLVHNDKIYIFYTNNGIFYYITYQNEIWSSPQEIQNLANTSGANINTDSRWIEYNGSIHILGGSTSSNLTQHISLNDSKLNDTSATLNSLRYKYANLSLQFRAGNVFIAPPVITTTTDAPIYSSDIEEAKYYVPQYLNYAGSLVSKYSKSYYKIIDIYNANISNSYGNTFVTV